MTKKLVVVMAAAVLAVCLLSGGCSVVDDSKLSAWKDLIKLPSLTEQTAQDESQELIPVDDSQQDTGEKINVKLYFEDSSRTKLVMEERSMDKVEGIARQTMQELLKGPSQNDCLPVFPTGTTLLDINIKPDGLCIVDLSSQADKVSSKEQGKLLVQAVANTLGQYPTVKEVSFLINGEKVNSLGGLLDITKPVQPNYNN